MVSIILATGWTEDEVLNTSHDIIHKMNVLTAVKQAVETKQSLKIDDETGVMKVQ